MPTSPRAVVLRDGSRLFGMDVDLFLKAERGRDRKWEAKVLEWVASVTKSRLEVKTDPWKILKSGVLLCKLINNLQKDCIPRFAKPKKGKKLHLLEELDNIKLYLKACQELGLESSQLFDLEDLKKGRGLAQVMNNIFALAMFANEERENLGFAGPYLRASSANRRNMKGPKDSNRTRKSRSRRSSILARVGLRWKRLSGGGHPSLSPTRPSSPISLRTSSRPGSPTFLRRGRPSLPDSPTTLRSHRISLGYRNNAVLSEISPRSSNLEPSSATRTVGAAADSTVVAPSDSQTGQEAAAAPLQTVTIDAEEAIQLLSRGHAFHYLHVAKSCVQRKRALFWYSPPTHSMPLGALYWCVTWGKRVESPEKCAAVHTITEVLLGKQTKRFTTAPNAKKCDVKNCFSLVTNNPARKGGAKTQVLDLEADCEEVLQLWLFGISCVLTQKVPKKLLIQPNNPPEQPNNPPE